MRKGIKPTALLQMAANAREPVPCAAWLARPEAGMPETASLFAGGRAQDKPPTETLKLLEGVMVLRTDEGGSVTMVLDSEKLAVPGVK